MDIEFPELENRWQTLLSRCVVEGSLEGKGDNSLAITLYRQLTQAYTESQRHYHTLEHLASMYRDLEDFEKQCSTSVSTALEFALWYHDVIYQPGRNDNEALSRELAERALTSMAYPPADIARVGVMIDCSKTHCYVGDDDEIQVFLDLDMAILGCDGSTYMRYSQAVRKEFSSIPGFLYRRGRKKFLKSVLAQSRIYGSDWFFERFESQARKNITWELENRL